MPSCTFFPSSDSLILKTQSSSCFPRNEEGRDICHISDVCIGKFTVEEKGRRASHHTRIRMDFNPKNSKLRDQEVVDKYLASYEFCLNPGIKIEFCPLTVDVSSTPP